MEVRRNIPCCSGGRKEQEKWFCPLELFLSKGQLSCTGLSLVSGWEFSEMCPYLDTWYGKGEKYHQLIC